MGTTIAPVPQVVRQATIVDGGGAFRARSLSAAAGVWLLAWGLAVAAPAEADTAARWGERLERAEAQVDETLQAQEALRTEIRARKAAGQTQQLQALLLRSLRAEEALLEALTELRQTREAARAGLQAHLKDIDGRIRRLVPALEAGPMASRRKAARQIQALRRVRSRVQDVLRRAEPPANPVVPAAVWDVEEEPLDGPEELREKADFVEDARDRLVAERQRLQAALQRARQEAEIRRAARDLATDVALFDEEARTARVNRGDGSDGELSVVGSGNGRDMPIQDESGAVSDPPVTGNGSAVDGPEDPRFDLGTDRNPNPGSGAELPGWAQLREVTPTVLLNLEAGGPVSGLSPGQLQRLTRNLKALDQLLAERALLLRRKARELEEREPGQADPAPP